MKFQVRGSGFQRKGYSFADWHCYVLLFLHPVTMITRSIALHVVRFLVQDLR